MESFNLSRTDAEDLAQITWLNVIRAADRFNPERNFLPWFITIARRLAINFVTRSRPPLDEIREDEAATQPDSDSLIDAEEKIAELTNLISHLPETIRLPIRLVYIESRERTDVARLLGIEVNALNQRLSVGRKKLRSLLMQD